METILAIDDTEAMRLQIAEILEFSGYRCLIAATGLEGLELARSAAPDLILCDIMMPEMDGYEVVSDLRLDSATATIPVIFLSALSEKADIRKGMAVGADDYVTKPFTDEDLLGAIRARLARHNQLEREQLTGQLRHLIQARESERRALAHYLDTDLLQPLDSLRLALDLYARAGSDQAGPLQEAYALLGGLVERLQHQLFELHPTLLDHVGLLPALLKYLREYESSTGIHVDFRQKNLHSPFEPELTIALFRIVQECLTNVARHAGVREALLSIEQVADQVMLQVADRGRGFSVDAALRSGKGYGLSEMRERVLLLQGTLSIESEAGHGTNVRVSLPCAPPASPSLDLDPSALWQSISRHLEVTGADAEGALPSPSGDARLLIADGQPLARRALRGLLESLGLTVVAEADNAPAVPRLLRQSGATLLVLDRRLPGASVLHLTRELLATQPDLGLILMDSRDDEAFAIEAWDAGASAYVLKHARPALEEALQRVMAGQRYLSPTLKPAALRRHAQRMAPSDASLQSYWSLTAREREILLLVAQGQRNQDIAEQLVLSVRTVETHRANLMRKLDLHSGNELVRFALQHGLLAANRPRDGELG